MQISSNSLCFFFLLFSLVSQTYGVSDENICEVKCDFCCRDKMCRSEDDCKGNFQPFVILGIVAGALIGLFIARKVYVYLKEQNAKKSREEKSKKSTRSTRTKAKVSKSKPSRSKSMKKEEKKSLKEDLYLQVDNDSVISPDSSVVKVDQPNQDLEKGGGKGDVNIKSKSELLKGSEKDIDKEKDDKKKDMMKASSASSKPTGTKTDPKKSDKNSTKKPASGASKKPQGSSKAGTKASGGDKERGRSAGRDGNKERSTSQKKASNTKDDKTSKAPKKNQV